MRGGRYLHFEQYPWHARPGRVRRDLSTVDEDISRLRALTDAAHRADELIAGMRDTVSEVRDALGSVGEGAEEPRSPATSASNSTPAPDQPMAICGNQIANAVITPDGASNWTSLVASATMCPPKKPGWTGTGTSVRPGRAGGRNRPALAMTRDTTRDTNHGQLRGAKRTKAVTVDAIVAGRGRREDANADS